MPGKLYIVATPIGHLSDLSPHAVAVLGAVDLIACENPGHSQKLLQHYQIRKPVDKLFDHNEQAKTNDYIKRLQAGQDIAYISDAGTPLISDPGYRLVNIAQRQNIQVVPIAGPCAAIAALSAAGLPTDRFSFEGFLPSKPAGRKKALTALCFETRTLVFYEAPHRIAEAILDAISIFGLMRLAVMAREISKQYETICQMPLGQLYQWVMQTKQDRGEIVLIIQGAQSKHEHHAMHDMIKRLSSHIQGKQLVNVIHALIGCPKQDVYRALEDIKNA